jgi:hypothetical protein
MEEEHVLFGVAKEFIYIYIYTHTYTYIYTHTHTYVHGWMDDGWIGGRTYGRMDGWLDGQHLIQQLHN